MEKEYLLTVVDRDCGFERECKLMQLTDIERVKKRYKEFSSENELRIYERLVTDWKKTDLEKIINDFGQKK